MPCLGPAYVPRRPHDTVLHRLVREHYETFLAYTSATYAAPLPRYVLDAFERYLVCGDFSRGFVRCHCDTCHHDVLVPFSCKQRGLCPSCGTRRMCDEGAVVTDRILPNVPIRQYVLSLPYELRGLAATKPDVLTALGRIFAEEIARTTKRRTGIAGTETGAVSFPQRFGGSLNLHVHFHTLAVDGVFEKQGECVRVHEASPPSKTDLDELVRRVHDRALVWLRRHDYVDDRAAEERESETKRPSPLDAFAVLALAGGTFVGRPMAPKPQQDAGFEHKERRFSAAYRGFDVHCAVRIAADDDEGRERLVRYCARPPFALGRIEELKDGRIAYRMKTPRRGSTHRVMTPMEFLARLAILVPPPFFPLTRYHGVCSARGLRPCSKPREGELRSPRLARCAARSSWRGLVTPKPPHQVPKKTRACNAPDIDANTAPHAPATKTVPRSGASDASVASVDNALTPAARDDATAITVAHWGRILDGELFATSSRLDWSVLLKRTHGLDSLRCPRCDSAMRPIATVTDPGTVRTILVQLDLRAEPLPRARARDPTGQASFAFDVA